MATAGPLPLEVSHHLGITPRWLDGTMVGGCSFMLHVRHAAAAIAAGAANVVLITHGESGRSRVGVGAYAARTPRRRRASSRRRSARSTPYATFTVPALRFLHERGMSRRDLAEVVVAQREWAAGNPRAFRRKPVTVEQVLDGPPIAYPFTRDMCCVVTDGGGALVLTSAERAADLPGGEHAVYLLGSGEASEAPLMSQMDDVGSFGAFRRASAEAFATAGVSHADIDHLMGYDAFAHLPLYMLEDLGFVGRGESGAFIARGPHPPGRLAAHEHQRRRPVLHPHRHVRHVRHPGGRPPAARAGRRPGARRHDQLRAGRRHVLRRRPAASCCPAAGDP